MKKLPDIQLPLSMGLKKVKVVGIKENNGSLTITFQKDLEFSVCPECGVISQKVKDRHLHQATDCPIFENGTGVQL